MMANDSYYVVMGGAALFTFVSYQLAVTFYDNNNDDEDTAGSLT